MPWLQIKLDVLPDNADQYEDLLLAAGCAAVTLQDKEDQPIFEPDLGTTPLWSNTVLTGLFSADHDLAATELFLKESHLQLFPNISFPSMKTEILEDKDWEREWMDNYHPMKFGNRLWVCPSWKEVPEPDAVNLMLDPGLAFGTGTHPTTALCLEFLDQLALDGKQVVDYGCGSGILGIATILLGAEHVTAVDIDPQALEASLDNLQRNQLPKESLKVYFPEKAPKEPADLVVANILAGPLVQLAPTLTSLCKTGGQLILSGLLSEQEAEIREAYGSDFELDAVAEKEGWIRVTGLKR
ncbi:MAG: 50S ribosomal protein L11 methyltransferase [Amphritea sp.]|nr:50S ribosomal protein L11 methyltransferase [Amphritea sp.]MBQ0783141.1 50S ribosomal protein L11 methyltransferase [Amphritea sp.]